MISESQNQIQISLVIPLLNEEESLVELHRWIKEVMDANQFSYEILFVDDGSSDRSWEMIRSLRNEFKEVRGIKFQRNYGKSAALFAGFEACKGEVVITMDADLQDSPEEIPSLFFMITKENFDLVSGWKKKRFDPISKTLPTKLFNWATRRLTGIHLHDFNCGLKAYKKSVVKSIEVYGEMHRYIPVLAKFAGFHKIGEKVVAHQARKYGVTKFGLNRFMNGFLDLLTVVFIGKFSKKPMHLFGAIGTLMFAIGFIIAVRLGVIKLFLDKTDRLIATRTEFYIALAAMIIGVQFFLAGFIAELIGRNSTTRNHYLIEQEL
jgi:glycosyltransferase involved in cell wall biosynthesis